MALTLVLGQNHKEIRAFLYKMHGFRVAPQVGLEPTTLRLTEAEWMLRILSALPLNNDSNNPFYATSMQLKSCFFFALFLPFVL